MKFAGPRHCEEPQATRQSDAPRHCEARSSPGSDFLDCFVVALLAMTGGVSLQAERSNPEVRIAGLTALRLFSSSRLGRVQACLLSALAPQRQIASGYALAKTVEFYRN
jgi:hypothetical protein